MKLFLASAAVMFTSAVSGATVEKVGVFSEYDVQTDTLLVCRAYLHHC